MKKHSKKYFIVLIIIAVIAVLGCAIYFTIFNTTHSNSLKIEKNDYNAYNNVVANGDDTCLLQIDDSLYYYYTGNGDVFKYGLYQISSGQTKRVYWQGPQISPPLFYMDNFCDNKILSHYTNGNDVDYFNFEKQDFESYFTVNNDSVELKGNYFVTDDKMFFYSNENNIYLYTDNELKLVATPESLGAKSDIIIEPYVAENYFYYQLSDQNGKIQLVKYDYNKAEITNKIDLSTSSADNDVAACKIFMCDSNTIYYSNNNAVYSADISKGSVNMLFEGNGDIAVNQSNNHIYVGVSKAGEDNGLYEIDIKSGQYSKLSEAISICEVYIMDSNYIYCVENKTDSLYRFNLTDNTLEQVFKGR